MSINQLPPINRVGLEPRGLSPHSLTTPQTFKALMEKAVRNETEGFTSAAPPISKAQLMDIVNNIRKQMDTHLMQALASEVRVDSEASYPSLLGHLPIPPVDSSNNRHLNQNNDVSEPHSPIEAVIREAAQTHGVDPALVRSVIKVESNFNPNSTSPKGAMGLMQLMPETARELGVKNGFDPIENVQAGTRYLKILLNRYEGNVSLALAAYNWGMGNLERKPGQMPVETKRYVEQVTRHYAVQKA